MSGKGRRQGITDRIGWFREGKKAGYKDRVGWDRQGKKAGYKDRVVGDRQGKKAGYKDRVGGDRQGKKAGYKDGVGGVRQGIVICYCDRSDCKQIGGSQQKSGLQRIADNRQSYLFFSLSSTKFNQTYIIYITIYCN